MEKVKHALAAVARAVTAIRAALSPSWEQDHPDTLAFVQEWMMSGDHEADQWHRDFAAAIDTRARARAKNAALYLPPPADCANPEVWAQACAACAVAIMFDDEAAKGARE